MEVKDWLPYIGPVVVALVAGVFATRSARRSSRVEEAKNRAQETSTQFTQATELDKYVTERVSAAVAKAVEPYEQRIERLERGYTQLVRTLRSVRQAFREYIRAVRAQWGHAVEPPAVDAHIRDLLAEDDLDGTFDAAGVAQFRDDFNEQRPD